MAEINIIDLENDVMAFKDVGNVTKSSNSASTKCEYFSLICIYFKYHKYKLN